MRIISLFIYCGLSCKYIQLQSRRRRLLLCDDYRCRRIKSLKRILFVIILWNILTAVNERCPYIDFRVEKFIMLICLSPYNLWILTEQLMIRNLFGSILFNWLRHMQRHSPQIFNMLVIYRFLMNWLVLYINEMLFYIF